MAPRLFALLALLFLLSTSREPPWADAHVVYDTTQALVNRGELSVQTASFPWFFAHRRGHKYGVFPLGNVVAMIPSYLAYSALRHIHRLPDQPLFALTCHLSPALLMAGACALFYRLCRRRGATRGWGALLALVLGLCTLCFAYGRSPYAEALQTMGLVWLVERALRQGERMTPFGMVGLGAAAGVLFNAKLVYALVLPVPVGYLVYRHLWPAPRDPKVAPAGLFGFLRGCLFGLLGFAPFIGVALWHNWLKTGSVLNTGYQGISGSGLFSGDLLPGLYGLTLSTGKSMFLYSPPLILGVLGLKAAWRRDRPETLFLLAVIAVVLLFNAKFPGWHGDYCWGPRHVTSITPVLLLLALPWLPEALQRGRVRLRRAALLSLLLAGLLVQLLGASLYWDHYIRILLLLKDQTGAAGWFHDQVGHGHYIPQFSPLRGHLWMLDHLIRHDPNLDRDAPWKLLVPQRADFSTVWVSMRIDWWALDWVAGPHPARGAGLGVLGLLSGGAVVAGMGLRSRLRRE